MLAGTAYWTSRMMQIVLLGVRSGALINVWPVSARCNNVVTMSIAKHTILIYFSAHWVHLGTKNV